MTSTFGSIDSKDNSVQRWIVELRPKASAEDRRKKAQEREAMKREDAASENTEISTSCGILSATWYLCQRSRSEDPDQYGQSQGPSLLERQSSRQPWAKFPHWRLLSAASFAGRHPHVMDELCRHSCVYEKPTCAVLFSLVRS